VKLSVEESLADSDNNATSQLALDAAQELEQAAIVNIEL